MLTTLLLMALHGLFVSSESMNSTIHHFNRSTEQHLTNPSDSSLYDVQKAYQLAKAQRDPQKIGLAAFQLGMAHYDQKQYEQAMEYFEEAKTMAEEAQDTELSARTFDKMAALFRKQDMPSLALSLQQTALQYASTAQQSELLISVLRNLGKTYWLLQQYDSALYYYQQRIPLCIEQGDIQILVEAYTDVANLLYNSQRFETCIPYYEQALNLSIKTKNKSYLSNINIAYAYTHIGAYQQAYYTLLTLIPILQQVHEENDLVAAYSTMGAISLQLANIEGSIKFFQHTVEIYLTMKDEQGVAKSLNNLGLAYYHFKDYYQAQKCLFKAQKICIKNGFNEIQAYTRDNLGRVYLALEQTDSALYHYHKALEIRQQIARPPHPNLADVHTELAKTYLVLKDYEEVEKHIQESVYALGVVEEGARLSVYEVPPPNTPISGEEYLDLMRLKGDYLGTAFTNTTAWEAGLRHYEGGIQFLLNSYVFAQDLDQSKLAWLTLYRPMFESGIALAHRLYEATHELPYLERAFALVEQNKAMLLRQSLRESQAKASAHLPDSLMATGQSLQEAISQTETALLKVDKTTDSLQYWQLKTTLTQEREAYFQWVEKIEAAYPEYYSIKYKTQAISLKEIQQQLPSHTLMVNYFLGEKELFGFGVSPDTVLCHKYPLPANWPTRLQTYYRAFTDHKYLMDSGEVVQHIIAEQGYSFYQTLVSPFLENTKENIEKLIVVPDGALNLLPFSVLLTEQPKILQYGRFPYLLKKMSVKYTYSANLYFQSQPDFLRSDKPYDFGGFTADYRVNDTTDTAKYQYLPEAEQLVEDAAEIMGGKSWKNTTKSTFLTFAPQCSIIHFGGHAIAGNASLSDNRLVFQADPPQERYLYLPEIYNLDLYGTELVVLSGCNTGIGEIKSGEGVISTARAFQYAGAQNVLLALNVIADASTRQLLHSFYENLDNGLSIDASLREAKLQYINKYKDDPLLSHPLYWASIITFGSNGAMTEAAFLYESSFFPVVVLIVLMVGGFLLWIFRKKIMSQHDAASVAR